MIKGCKVISEDYPNDVLTIDLFDPTSCGFQIVAPGFDGMSTLKSSLTIAESAYQDGGQLTGAHIAGNAKNIVFNCQPLDIPSVHENRERIFRFFRVNSMVSLTFYSDAFYMEAHPVWNNGAIVHNWDSKDSNGIEWNDQLSDDQINDWIKAHSILGDGFIYWNGWPQSVKDSPADMYYRYRQIIGYVESVESTVFNDDGSNEKIQVSIICPYPFYSDLAYSNVGNTGKILYSKGFEWPHDFSDANYRSSQNQPTLTGQPAGTVFGNTDITLLGHSYSIQNDGDVDSYVSAYFNFYEDSKDILTITFNDGVFLLDPAKSYGIGGMFKNGDEIFVDFQADYKAVTLTRGGVKYNIISGVIDGSDWPYAKKRSVTTFTFSPNNTLVVCTYNFSIYFQDV